MENKKSTENGKNKGREEVRRREKKSDLKGSGVRKTVRGKRLLEGDQREVKTNRGQKATWWIFHFRFISRVCLLLKYMY